MKFAPLLLIALFAIDCGSGGAPPQAETPAQAAQKAGEQKEPCLRREEIAPFSKRNQDSRDETSQDVHGEGARRKPPIDRVMEDQTGHLVPGDGSDRAT